MHNKILNKYYFINKFDQSHIDKQDKETTIIYRNYNQEIDKKLILNLRNYCKKNIQYIDCIFSASQEITRGLKIGGHLHSFQFVSTFFVK